MKRWHLYILIAVGVVLSAAFFYLMFGPPTQIERNEEAAISALRVLNSAQELYKTHGTPYGDYHNLYNEKFRNVHINANLSAADPDHPQHKPLNGYRIDISVEPTQNSDWCAFARPAKWGVTGARNFKVESGGIIWYNETENSSQFTRNVPGYSREELDEKYRKEREEQTRKYYEEKRRKEQEERERKRQSGE
jgi:hypothetical protein